MTRGVTDINGELDVAGREGAVNTLGSTVQATLLADKVQVRMETLEGHVVYQPGGDPFFQATPEGGQVEWSNFTSVRTTFQPGERTPQVLALPGNSGPFAAQSLGAVSGQHVSDVEVARHWENFSQGNAESVGFYKTLAGPTVALRGVDRAEVSGNFSLFVNNVTIRVVESAEGTWSAWTGYRQSDPSTPAGPASNPQAKAYEVRSTTIDVIGGRLWLNTSDEVDVYSSAVHAAMKGTMTASNVSGQLLADSDLYAFDGDPVRLQGEGRITFQSGSTDAGGLAIEPVGPFGIAPGSDVERRSLAVPGGVPFVPGWMSTVDVWHVLLGAAAVFAAGLVVLVGRYPDEARGVWDRTMAAWWPNRYEVWLGKADEAFRDRAYGRAAKWYGKAVRGYSHRQLPWFRLMLTHLETSSFEDVLAVAERAEQQFGTLPADVLELCTLAAAGLGKHDYAVQLLLKLADKQPGMAVVVLDDPGMEEVREDDRVRRVLSGVLRKGEPGSMAGYA